MSSVFKNGEYCYTFTLGVVHVTDEYLSHSPAYKRVSGSSVCIDIDLHGSTGSREGWKVNTFAARCIYNSIRDLEFHSFVDALAMRHIDRFLRIMSNRSKK